MSSIPEPPFNAIIVGPYKNTRIVEQFTNAFASYMWIDTATIRGNESWEYTVQPLISISTSSGTLSLLLIEINHQGRADYLKSQIFHRALYSARYHGISILLLDKYGMMKIDESIPMNNLIPHVFLATVPCSLNFIKRFYAHFKDLSRIMDIVGNPTKQGKWWKIDYQQPLWNADYTQQVDITPFEPWLRQIEWNTTNHTTFSDTVHERVLLLLMAQYDQDSLLSKLDRNCLMELLYSGAGMDEYTFQHDKPILELDSMPHVFTKSRYRSRWAELGIPDLWIYSSDFKQIIDQIIQQRYRLLNLQGPDNVKPLYIIIDQIPYERAYYQTFPDSYKIQFIDFHLWDIRLKGHSTQNHIK